MLKQELECGFYYILDFLGVLHLKLHSGTFSARESQGPCLVFSQLQWRVDIPFIHLLSLARATIEQPVPLFYLTQDSLAGSALVWLATSGRSNLQERLAKCWSNSSFLPTKGSERLMALSVIWNASAGHPSFMFILVVTHPGYSMSCFLSDKQKCLFSHLFK